MLGFGLLTIAGYVVLLGSRTTGVLYFACFLVYAYPHAHDSIDNTTDIISSMGGALIAPGLNITWISSKPLHTVLSTVYIPNSCGPANTAGHYKRATAIGINQMVGNLGGVVAGQIYLAKEAPYYVTGHSISLVGMGLAWCCTWAMMFLLHKKNAEKQKKIEQGVVDEKPGDQNIHFTYRI